MHIYRASLITAAAAFCTTSNTGTLQVASAFQTSIQSYAGQRINIHALQCPSFLSQVKTINYIFAKPKETTQHRLYSTPPKSSSSFSSGGFQRGQLIQVEVSRFGQLGASVDIIAVGGHTEDYLIDEYDPPLGTGLILQSEISYFRRKRNGLDVIVGEILPAYVERTREMTDGGIKVDISLRPPGKAKSLDLATDILQKLKDDVDNNGLGVLEVGDKSTPKEIDAVFPGASKAAFKKAVSSLYKQGKVKPGPFSISLMKK